MAMERIAVASTVFLAATEAAMGLSSIEVASGTGGVLQSILQTMHTAANCIPISSPLSEATSIRRKGFQFVASGIDLTLRLRSGLVRTTSVLWYLNP